MSLATKALSLTDPAWSTDVTVAASVYGTAAQMQVIRYLRVNGPSTRNEIAENIGLNYGRTAKCLNKLKSAGVVSTAVPMPEVSAEEHNTKPYKYILQPARAQALLDALASCLTEPSLGQ